MAIRKSNQRRDGRYVYGGVVESKGNRLGWWERQIFPTHHSDVPYIIPKQHARRPDLLAYEVYGRSNLMWMVLQYNHIVDINTEFVEGAEIMLPTVQRMFGELLVSTIR